MDEKYLLEINIINTYLLTLFANCFYFSLENKLLFKASEANLFKDNAFESNLKDYLLFTFR